MRTCWLTCLEVGSGIAATCLWVGSGLGDLPSGRGRGLGLTVVFMSRRSILSSTTECSFANQEDTSEMSSPCESASPWRCRRSSHSDDEVSNMSASAHHVHLSSVSFLRSSKSKSESHEISMPDSGAPAFSWSFISELPCRVSDSLETSICDRYVCGVVSGVLGRRREGRGAQFAPVVRRKQAACMC